MNIRWKEECDKIYATSIKDSVGYVCRHSSIVKYDTAGNREYYELSINDMLYHRFDKNANEVGSPIEKKKLGRMLRDSECVAFKSFHTPYRQIFQIYDLYEYLFGKGINLTVSKIDYIDTEKLFDYINYFSIFMQYTLEYDGLDGIKSRSNIVLGQIFYESVIDEEISNVHKEYDEILTRRYYKYSGNFSITNFLSTLLRKLKIIEMNNHGTAAAVAIQNLEEKLIRGC